MKSKTLIKKQQKAPIKKKKNSIKQKKVVAKTLKSKKIVSKILKSKKIVSKTVEIKEENLRQRKIFHWLAGALLILIIVFVLIFFKDVNKVLNNEFREAQNPYVEEIKKITKYYNLKTNNDLEKQISKHVNLFFETPFSFRFAIIEYVRLYHEAEKMLVKLEKDKFINKRALSSVRKQLKNLEFLQAIVYLKTAAVQKISSVNLAEKEYLIGLIHELDFRYEKAGVYYKKAIKFNYYNAKYHNRLGWVYAKLEKTDFAIDSFEKALSALNVKNLNAYVKTKVDILSGLGVINFNKGNLSQAFKYYSYLFSYASAKNDVRAEWIALFNLGHIAQIRGDLVNAIEYYELALPMAYKMKNQSLYALTLTSIGRVYYDYGDYDKSLSYNKKGYEMAHKIQDNRTEGSAMYHMCLAYEYLGQRVLAEVYCNNAVKKMTKTAVALRDHDLFMILGNMYGYAATVRNHDKSLSAYTSAYKLIKERNLKQKETKVLTKLGIANRGLGKREEALKYFYESLLLNEDYQSNACTECNLAMTYSFMNKKEIAVRYFEAAIYKAKNNENKNYLSTLYANLGLVYKDLENYEKAEEYLKESISLHKKIHRYDHHYIKWAESSYKRIVETKKEVK